jgi:Ca2+-binding RTX toxin-like protein
LGAKAQAAGITKVVAEDVLADSDDNLTIDATAYTSAVTLTIEGSDDADTNGVYKGGAGADTIKTGDGGDDSLYGAAGNDYFEIASVGVTKIFDLGGSDVIEIKAGGGNSLAASSIATSDFTAGTGSINNSATALKITTTDTDGLIDMSLVTGGNSGFHLIGSTAANVIKGSAKIDTLSGLAGDDVLTGGTGADKFKFEDVTAGGTDKITDFSGAAGEGDKIYGDVAALTDTTAVTAYTALGAITGADLATVLATFAAGQARATTIGTADSFTYGGRAYLVIDSATDGYTAALDTVIDLGSSVPTNLAAGDIIYT